VAGSAKARSSATRSFSSVGSTTAAPAIFGALEVGGASPGGGAAVTTTLGPA
jgi:hypothetical protein